MRQSDVSKNVLLTFSLMLLLRDGTSIVLSDEVGQIYFLNTGQGEAQKDAKYDQVAEKSN